MTSVDVRARSIASVSAVRRPLPAPVDHDATVEDVRATRSELGVAERHAGMLEERERLAAELHDTLAQELSSIVMLLEAAQTSVGKESRPAAEHVTHALRAAREGLREIRRVVWSLRPEALERGTLVEALHRLATEGSQHGPMAVRLTVTGERYALSTETQVALLRVAQEALANARRHANARIANITLSFMADGVMLKVRDNGRGFNPVQVGPRPEFGRHVGLVAMRERVQALGGTLTIETAPGKGTTVVAAIPEHALAPQHVA